MSNLNSALVKLGISSVILMGCEVNAANSVKKDSSTIKITEKTGSDEFVYYTVRKGDNFWSIAKKFPGVSNDDIMKLNNIKSTNSNGLRVGQILKILPKA